MTQSILLYWLEQQKNVNFEPKKTLHRVGYKHNAASRRRMSIAQKESWRRRREATYNPPGIDSPDFVKSQTERVKIKLNVGDVILCSMACELGFYACRENHSLMWAMNKLRENMEEINDGPLANQPRSS